VDSPQSQNLFHVMIPVQPMKFPPLLTCERPKDRMVDQPDSTPMPGLTLCDELVHGQDGWPNLGDYFFCRHSTRYRIFGRLSRARQITSFYGYYGEQAVFQSGRPRQRFPCSQTALESFYGPSVGKKQMLEDLRGAPLPFGMAGEIFNRHATCG
jgi:non-ribosomal peptide synthetase component F